MSNKLLLRRGAKASLPTLSSGEPAYTTDTLELFVGTGSGNVNMTGSQIYTGTAMSGTSTTEGAYYYSACPLVKLGDLYLNTSNGNVYKCTTTGSGSTAKWTYQGCIKGATGVQGATGNGISSIAVTYQSGTSSTTAPTGTWSTTIPSVSAGSYLWTRFVITYTSGTTQTAYSVARQGADGTSVSISSTSVTYQASTSGTTTPTGTWSTTIPTVAAGSYLWTKTVVTYSNGTSTTAYSVAKQGTSVTVDTALSTSSSNPVQNKVITEALGKKFEPCGSIYKDEQNIGSSGSVTIYDGSGSTRPTAEFRNCVFLGTVILRNMKVIIYCDGDKISSTGNIIFENCDVYDRYENDNKDRNGLEIYNGTGDVTFVNSSLHIRAREQDSCYSGIKKAGTVTFIGGDVELDSGNTAWNVGFDCNLIYECDRYSFDGTTIRCTGANCINIVKQSDGAGGFNGGAIYLGSNLHSICHEDEDENAKCFMTGVYVEYYGSYMKFGAISGCVFNHLAAGTSSANQLVLKCPTCMTGNHFIGSAVYIDGQDLKHIVTLNLSDNGITIGSGTYASGSTVTGNITY